MKLFCRVHGKQAVVIGYGPGRKGRVRAIVIVNGQLKDVGLKDIVLDTPESGGDYERRSTLREVPNVKNR